MKKASKISMRSLVEPAIFRYKTQLDASLHSRKMERQVTEVRIGAKIINKFTHLGMPKYRNTKNLPCYKRRANQEFNLCKSTQIDL